MPTKLFQLNQWYYLWSEILESPYKQGFEVDVISNFDYETDDGEKKWVYTDIGIRFNYVSIIYRSGFEFGPKKLTWKDIFVVDTVAEMMKIAIHKTLDAYNVYCEVNKIPVSGSLTIPDTLSEQFAKGMIEQYTLYRSIADKKNDYLLKTKVLKCTCTFEMYNIFKYTFDILDEVLFNHRAFNKPHNQEIFGETVPLPRYATIKNNCKAIERKDVHLNGIDTILFFQCLDCALQMLVGDKADVLITELEQQGFDAELQAAFISSGTALINQLNSVLKESNVRITNLEKRINWLNIIK